MVTNLSFVKDEKKAIRFMLIAFALVGSPIIKEFI